MDAPGIRHAATIRALSSGLCLRRIGATGGLLGSGGWFTIRFLRLRDGHPLRPLSTAQCVSAGRLPNIYYFLPKGLHDATPGFAFTQVTKVLDDEGWLVAKDKGKHLSKTMRISGQKQRLYAVKPDMTFI